MAYGRRYNRRPARGRRRHVDWANHSTIGGTGLDLDDSNRVIVTNLLGSYQTVLGSDVDGTTITRVRAHFYWVPPATILQEYTGLIVGIMTGEQAFNASLTDAQQITRMNNPDLDWMYYREHQIASASAISGNGAFAAQGWPNDFELDLKSQRRLESLDESLFMWIGLKDTVGDGNALKFFHHVRTLIKKP